MLIGSWFWTMAIPFWTHFNAVAKTKITALLTNVGYVLWIVLSVVLIPNTLADVHLAGLGVVGGAYSYLISGVALLLTSIVALLFEVRIKVTYQSARSAVVAILLGGFSIISFTPIADFRS